MVSNKVQNMRVSQNGKERDGTRYRIGRVVSVKVDNYKFQKGGFAKQSLSEVQRDEFSLSCLSLPSVRPSSSPCNSWNLPFSSFVIAVRIHLLIFCTIIITIIMNTTIIGIISLSLSIYPSHSCSFFPETFIRCWPNFKFLRF